MLTSGPLSRHVFRRHLSPLLPTFMPSRRGLVLLSGSQTREGPAAQTNAESTEECWARTVWGAKELSGRVRGFLEEGMCEADNISKKWVLGRAGGRAGTCCAGAEDPEDAPAGLSVGEEGTGNHGLHLGAVL